MRRHVTIEAIAIATLAMYNFRNIPRFVVGFCNLSTRNIWTLAVSCGVNLGFVRFSNCGLPPDKSGQAFLSTAANLSLIQPQSSERIKIESYFLH